MITYFHGGEKVYERLAPGTGIDGVGIYLTSNRSRAEMYAKRDSKGKERKPFITEVGVDTRRARIWDDQAEVDLRDFTDASWLAELVERYGPAAPKMNGQNARIYLGWSEDRSNAELKRRGFQAIRRGSDLVVLDPSIIEYSVKIIQ